MNRRQFTTRLAALFAAPALPASAVSAAASAPVAAPVALSTGASSWASYLMAMHKTCTPTMLKSVLNVSEDMAQTLHSRMVSDGIIQDGNRVVRDVKQRIKSALETPDMPDTRPAVADDLDALADIWFDGWFEAHAAHVPDELKALRSRDSLRIRLEDMLENTDVVGPVGAPVGFCTVKGDEIYQFYVSPSARGSGTADALLQAGEKRLADSGIEVGQLWVLPENARAIAFYRRNGWDGDTVEDVPLDTLDGPYLLPCRILQKTL
ncbi:MAG TPA: GNAT family N-acetyltransferase [Rhodobacteraceae bacterium]|nr:GNAT family N-acetyltransferase [Paracoccaceae bacterium]